MFDITDRMSWLNLPSLKTKRGKRSYLIIYCVWKYRNKTSKRLTVLYLSVSEPFLAMIIFNLPSPPTGALSVPVVNWRNSLFCSSPNEWIVSQKSLWAQKTTLSSNASQWQFCNETCCSNHVSTLLVYKGITDLLDYLTVFAITAIIFCCLFKCFKVKFLWNKEIAM